jgi:hypothetical protein
MQEQQVTLVLIRKNLRKGTEDPLTRITGITGITTPRKKKHIAPAHVDEYAPYEFGPVAAGSLLTQNAGGNSLMSEAFSIQYFIDLGAHDILLEKQVMYDFFGCKMVDFIMTHCGKRVGVSVARAMSFKGDEPFDRKRAEQLLVKKLSGLVIARNCVSEVHAFFTSILHVQCETREMATLLQSVYQDLIADFSWNENLKGTLHLVLTVVHRRSPFCQAVFNRVSFGNSKK